MIYKNIFRLVLLISYCISNFSYAENTFIQRQLLFSNQFSELEANLAKANDDYLAKSISINAYYAFTKTFWFERDIPNSTLFDALTLWLESNPKSAYAHVLMGIYWSDKAHQARGTKWGKDTSEKQINEMNKHFNTAWEYLQKGLQLNPSILQAYVAHLSITRTSSLFGTPQQFMQKIVPAEMKHNLEIWDALLQTLIPRWGGSYLRMENIISKQVPTYISNLSEADTQALSDSINYDRIDTLTGNKKHKMALEVVSKSIDNNTQYAAIYSIAGHVAYKLKGFKSCYLYEGKATKLRPWSAFSWKKRGLCAIKLQQWPQANEAFRYVVFINGLNKYNLFKLGQTYMYLLQFDKAYAVFKKAEELDPEYKRYTKMYTGYIEKEKTDKMGLLGQDIYQIIGNL